MTPHSNLAARTWVDFVLSLLNIGNEVGVMMVTVVVMAVYDHHGLRLRRIWYREAEDENQSEQNPFHLPSMAHGKVMRRATLTSAHTHANRAQRTAEDGSFDAYSCSIDNPAQPDPVTPRG